MVLSLFNVVYIQLGGCISIVVGQLLGAGKVEEAKDADNKMIFFSVACCTGVAFIMIIVIIMKTLIWGDPVGGWPSLVCIIMFMGGLQLFCMGILGQYLSKTYLETKKRPIFIIAETNEDLNDEAETH